MSTSYRPDIQGLRALAVVLVLVYHAGADWMGAGFIGVDVFFVVSGYLITGLLIEERLTTGRIALSSFYARRARRLLPAAVLTIIVTVVLAYLYFPTLRRESVGKDALASALYAQNWRLAGLSVDYVAQESAPSPFQHFWSLAVEEQFYIFWPALMVVGMRGRQGFARSGAYRRRLGLVLATVAAASFSWSVFRSYDSPGPAYFETTTRVWEFAAGAGLTLVESRRRFRPAASIAAAVTAVGIAVVIGSAVLTSTSTPFPGYIAAIPVLGTLMILAAAPSAIGTLPHRALSGRPQQWVGDISYSLYLWHWPMLLTAREISGPLSQPAAYLVVAASAVPAVLSLRLVENPIRYASRLRPTRASLLAGGACTAVAAVAAVALLAVSPQSAAPPASASIVVPVLDSPGNEADAATPVESTPPTSAGDQNTVEAASTTEPSRSPQALGAQALEELSPASTPGAITTEPDFIVPDPSADPTPGDITKQCITKVEDDELTVCEYGPPDADVDVVLIGDSHAAQWSTPLYDIATGRGWRYRVMVKQSCPMLAEAPREPCDAWNERVRTALADDPPTAIVVSAFERQSNPNRVDAFRQAWSALVDRGVRVVVLADTPYPEFDVRECLFDHRDDVAQCGFPQSVGLSTGQNLRDAILPGVRYVDLNPWICPLDPCAPVIGNVMVYRDSHHLSDQYARSLAAILQRLLVTEGDIERVSSG